MSTIISEHLGKVTLGEAQTHRNITIFPLMLGQIDSPAYLSLKQAMREKVLQVGEVDEGGSVPELQVFNTGDCPVLLLDGEELVGAKQNRVLNTTILVEAKSQIIVPVSCTEQGRWRYTSKHFDDSDVVMAPRARAVKSASVSKNLKTQACFQSNQGKVWNEVEDLHAKLGTDSDTGAMKDAYTARGRDLEEALEAFGMVPDQHGLLAVIGGKPAGFDLLSLDSIYRELHDKLAKSYVIDGISRRRRKVADGDPAAAARSFLEGAAACTGEKHKSPGVGWDFRFEGPGQVGSALVYEDCVIHSAFFRTEEQKVEDEAFPGYRNRRRYRGI